jgi:MFS family permease
MKRILSGWRSIPRSVRIFGIVSFLTDVASEMIYPLLPYFITNVLGAGAFALGTIEGASESLASILKGLSGALTDRLKRKKPLIVLGYTLSAIAKPLIGLARFPWHVLSLRILDRTGKGIRTSPRDAFIAETTPVAVRGRSFGFHRSMDSLGAVLGPTFAALFLWLTKAHLSEEISYRAIFLISLIPGIAAVFVLIKGIEEKPSLQVKKPPPFGRVPQKGFWFFLFTMALFSLGNSSDTFVLLRAQNLGIHPALIPIIYLIFNSVYALTATPMGILSDRLGRKFTLGLGLLIYSLVYISLSLKLSPLPLLMAFILYGLYYAVFEGVGRAFVADLVPEENRGTAYGYYHMTIGILLLPASLIAGFLWDKVGPEVPFLFGGSLALLSSILLLLWSLWD